MEEVLLASSSTNATSITVEEALFISIIIVQTTDFTEILSKFFFTVNTSSSFRLNCVTSETFNFSHFVSIKLMVFLRVHFSFEMNSIVTQPARPEGSLSTLGVIWTFHMTRSLIVRTLVNSFLCLTLFYNFNLLTLFFFHTFFNAFIISFTTLFRI